MKDVFEDGPFPYDLKLGTSDKGDVIDFVDFKRVAGFKHGIVFFGGLEGIEGIIAEEEFSSLKVKNIESMFDMYLNTCPEQGTRTIRTEEAIVLSMAAIFPRLRKVGYNLPTVN